MPKGRVATLTYLLLVFGSGTLVGAVAHRLFTANTVSATIQPTPAQTPAQMRQQYLTNLRKHVGASEDQVQKINALLDDAKRRYNELDQQAKPAREKIDKERNDAILAVFTPDQQKSYLAWRAEVRAKREKERLEKERAEKAQSSSTR